MAKPPRELVCSWIALCLLLVLTLAMAFVPLGSGNIVLSLAIATAKAAIVILVFMKLADGPAVTRIAALAGVFWLLLLFGLTFTDYATRSGFPAPP